MTDRFPPEATVYRVTHGGGNRPTAYHSDPDCRQLANAAGVTDCSLANAREDLRPCPTCVLGRSPDGGDSDYGHYESLKRAAKQEADQ